LALRVITHGLAVTVSAILLALLAVPGLLAVIRTHWAGWPSAWEWAFGFLMFVVLPLLSAAIASLLAEAVTRCVRPPSYTAQLPEVEPRRFLRTPLQILGALSRAYFWPSEASPKPSSETSPTSASRPEARARLNVVGERQ
jgi:hypothetical protein